MYFFSTIVYLNLPTTAKLKTVNNRRKDKIRHRGLAMPGQNPLWGKPLKFFYFFLSKSMFSRKISIYKYNSQPNQILYKKSNPVKPLPTIFGLHLKPAIQPCNSSVNAGQSINQTTSK